MVFEEHYLAKKMQHASFALMLQNPFTRLSSWTGVHYQSTPLIVNSPTVWSLRTYTTSLLTSNIVAGI